MQVFKDPYLFDFLGTADPRREQEVEWALTDHIQRFLLELGAGFAFMGFDHFYEIMVLFRYQYPHGPIHEAAPLRS